MERSISLRGGRNGVTRTWLRNILELDMTYRATFYRGEIMDNQPPVLQFNARDLVPCDIQQYGSLWHLHYPAGTPEHASIENLKEQLRKKGYTLIRRGRLPDGKIEVIFEKTGVT